MKPKPILSFINYLANWFYQKEKATPSRHRLTQILSFHGITWKTSCVLEMFSGNDGMGESGKFKNGSAKVYPSWRWDNTVTYK